MKHIADALVYAVAFFASAGEDVVEDRAALKAIDSIVGCLAEATEQEKDALAQAAKSAYGVEQASAYPREAWLESYQNWMEHLFGEEEWKGNERVV